MTAGCGTTEPYQRLTIIVPAFNEEAYLGPTLDAIRAAAELLHARSNVDIETIVVDNGSRDRTAAAYAPRDDPRDDARSE